MKILTLSLMLAMLGSVASANASHVSISAKAVAYGGSGAQKQSSRSSATSVQGTSYTKTQSTRVESKEHSTSVEISARNFGKDPEEVKIRWFFFTAKVSITNRSQNILPEVIRDHGEESWSLKPSETKKSVITSEPVEMTVTSKSTTGFSSDSSKRLIPRSSRDVTGEKLRGWAIQLVSGDKVIQTVGSSTKYQAIANDPAKLEAMMEKESRTTAINP